MIIKINKNIIANNNETYFIADIAANHDGSLKKAKELIRLAAESGANAAKFQHFKAETIVSDFGFKSLKKKFSHQKKWKESIFDVYQKAELPLAWTEELSETCGKYKIDFFTACYDLDYVNIINKYVPAWKVGSGDITWHEIILKMAKTNKPILIATGASNEDEVDLILRKIKKINKKIVLMQCNTNYTAEDSNFDYINLNSLKLFRKKYPKIILGLSDHTYGHETVLGAIALGARVIEKHFTYSNNVNGPDHKFSMNPASWEKMVSASRKLERSLGFDRKIIEENEKDTAILQRRAVRANKALVKGSIITKDDFVFLRPCPKHALKPYEYYKLIGKKLKKKLPKHQIIKLKDLY